MKTIKSLTIATTLAVSSLSFAGTVKLESPKFENICKVQITTGTRNTYLKTYSNVTKGFTVSGEDRLCYRRSAKPNQCDSNFTEWTCSSKNGSGTHLMKLT